MSSLPSLPSDPLRVEDARALSVSNTDIAMVWPLWGWTTSDDLLTIGLAIFTNSDIHLTGFDSTEERWADVSRFTDVDLGDPAPLVSGFSTLESWIREHYATDELVRFDLDLEFP